MGGGVLWVVPVRISGTSQWTRAVLFKAQYLCKKQALGLLVPVGSTHCCASTSGLSTQWSAGGLTW